MHDKHKLKKYNISIVELANIFELKNEMTLRNSTAFKRYVRATIRIIERVETEIANKINV